MNIAEHIHTVLNNVCKFFCLDKNNRFKFGAFASIAETNSSEFKTIFSEEKNLHINLHLGEMNEV